MTENRRHWHIDKSVSIGHLLTTVMLVVSGTFWFVKNEARITTIENATLETDRRIDKVEIQLVAKTEWTGKRIEQIRLEQKADNQRLSDQIRVGFQHMQEALNKKADK